MSKFADKYMEFVSRLLICKFVSFWEVLISLQVIRTLPFDIFNGTFLNGMTALSGVVDNCTNTRNKNVLRQYPNA